MDRPLSLLFLLLFILHLSRRSHQQPINPIDKAALLAIRRTLDDIPGSNFFSTWDFTAPDPCSSFSGLTCFPDPSSSALRVTALQFGTGLSDSPGLLGSLSPRLSNLTQLAQLVLFPGIVTGPIPPELGQLKNLRVISLTNNRLTGPIPQSLASLPNLHTLDLSHNQLTGSIPAQLTELPQIKVLILASNRLTGELPSRWTQLLHLDLKMNDFAGRIPSNLPSSLRYLSLSENQMWGPLKGLEKLSELVFLDISMNSFNGTIPSSLFRPSLNSMLLQRNNLFGAIPPRTADQSYGPGSVIDLSHNFLTGQLPPTLAGAESLFLNNNRLIAKVPQEYVKSVCSGATKTLYLQHNYITEFPMEKGAKLPDSVSLCLSYNCMVPPVGLSGCPASAGGQLCRPAFQCAVFNNGTTIA
ncbi:Leucine-rich repeat [Dillenia turbinata]|uniref:Leucine-rich repeat n=1 Tax=Dillenia turbinata TaxID=194707 RepID=A0AAN8UQH9_9MAGN